jgi:hypothetical protein
MKKYEYALIQCNKSIELDPKNSEIFNLKGR